jgi:hypothetical protein
MNWLKRFFCAHRYEWMRNIYGDEINISGGKRSLWGCVECGKVQARDGLHDDGDLRGVAGPLPERGWDNAEA